MKRKKTHEEYVAEVAKIHSDIEVMEEYKGDSIKILHKCKIDGHEWNPYPTNILKGHGCPLCANNQRSKSHALTRDEYINKIFDINPKIELIGDYKNANFKTTHLCKVCGNKWLAYPSNILSGKGCKVCGSKSSADFRRKTQLDYLKQVQNINNNIIVLGEYKTAKDLISHQCNICGNIWYASPDNILHGHGCPRCSESQGERVIRGYLQSNFINFKSQYTFDDCKNKKLLPFDFYLTDYNICIEYDGIQHFQPVEYFGGEDELKQVQKRDAIKTQYCEDNNIPLLRIRYDQNIILILKDFLLQHKVNFKEAAS